MASWQEYHKTFAFTALFGQVEYACPLMELHLTIAFQLRNFHNMGICRYSDIDLTPRRKAPIHEIDIKVSFEHVSAMHRRAVSKEWAAVDAASRA